MITPSIQSRSTIRETETIMEIIYDTVEGVDVEFRIYKICSICFEDMRRSGEFSYPIPDVLTDQIENTKWVYQLDIHVPCDSLDPSSDLESTCAMKQSK
jgi:hypothetical protein